MTLYVDLFLSARAPSCLTHSQLHIYHTTLIRVKKKEKKGCKKKGTALFYEIFLVNSCLFEDCKESSFRNIPPMKRYGYPLRLIRIVVNHVTSRSMIELESMLFQNFDDFFWCERW